MVISNDSFGAWEVPNSRMVIGLSKARNVSYDKGTREEKITYEAGVSLKCGKGNLAGYTVFKEDGNDRFNSLEKLLAKIDKAAETIFRVADWCDSVKLLDIPVVYLEKWQSFPPRDDDFVAQCFSSLSRFMWLMDKSKQDFRVVLHRKEFNPSVYYSACILVGEEVVFKAKPAFERKDVVGNLKMAFLGAGAWLNKLQDVAWGVLVDSDNPDYDVERVYGQRGSRLLKKSD